MYVCCYFGSAVLLLQKREFSDIIMNNIVSFGKQRSLDFSIAFYPFSKLIVYMIHDVMKS